MRLDGVTRRKTCVVIPAERLQAKRQQRGRLRMVWRSWRCVVPHRVVDAVRKARAENKQRLLAFRGTVLEDMPSELIDEFEKLRGTNGN